MYCIDPFSTPPIKRCHAMDAESKNCLCPEKYHFRRSRIFTIRIACDSAATGPSRINKLRVVYVNVHQIQICTFLCSPSRLYKKLHKLGEGTKEQHWKVIALIQKGPLALQWMSKITKTLHNLGRLRDGNTHIETRSLSPLLILGDSVPLDC